MNIIAALQRWMDSKPGQTFLNYAYSWGASVVILGTLFKLTHLKGANLMLFIGMGTEVVVFFLSAFDRPFQTKNEEAQAAAEGRPIAGSAYAGGVVGGSGEALAGPAEQAETTGHEATASGGAAASQGGGGNVVIGGGGTSGSGTTVIGGGSGGGGTIIIGGGATGGGTQTAEQSATPASEQGGDTTTPSSQTPFTPSAGLQAAASQQGIGGGSLLDIIRLANEEMLQRAQASLTPEMEEASKKYVEKLQQLTTTLERVEQQSARLTTDSEEMTNLNRTLTGINTVYELQLKSISQQVGTIDSINEQTRRMAAQIEELNGVYARMIKALTVNMKNAANTMG